MDGMEDERPAGSERLAPRLRIITMNRDQSLREHLLYLLRGGGAHLNFDSAIADLPAKLRLVAANKRPSG